MSPSRRLLILCLWLALQSAAAGQAAFHRQIDGLYAASGLAVLPGGDHVVAGSWADCAQLLRCGPDGAVLWSQEVCPQHGGDDFENGSWQLTPGAATGTFFAVVRKAGAGPGADHVLNLMKFDDTGTLLWQQQLPPYVSFGPLSSGRQIAVAPGGTVWAVHGIGDTEFSNQSFNQVLLFKVSADGELLLRSSYQTTGQSTANGVWVRSDDEIYVYGGLGYSIGDGFLLKINGSGAVQWAKQYPDFFFYRDGGQFANGDLLLYGQSQAGIVFARVRLDDGALVWLKKLSGDAASGLYAVAADQGILATLGLPGAGTPRALVKLSANAGTVEWVHTYETCTAFPLLNAQPTPDNGLILLQDGNLGLPQTRLLKVDAQGQLPAGCDSRSWPLPIVEDRSIAVSALDFFRENGPLPSPEALAKASPSSLQATHSCPAQSPIAALALPDSVCAQAPLQLVSSGNAQALQWTWFLPGAMPDQAQGAVTETLLYPAAGIYPVTLVQRYGLCVDTVRDSLHVRAGFTADLFAFSDTLLCPDTPFVALPLAADFEAWAWEDGSIEFERHFDSPRVGTYRLTVQKDGCTVSDSFYIRLARCAPLSVFVPNAFAPDAAAPNNVWTLSLLAGSELLSCAVYDRWGSLLYTTTAGEMPHWEGQWQGRDLPPGVYWWLIRVRHPDGKEELMRGNVTLVR